MTCIGFISAPNWFDPAPAEFPQTVVETVQTQQSPILAPDFDYSLQSVAAAGDALQLCAKALKGTGCDIIAQVGSPFAWALIQSEAEARLRCTAISQAADLPAVMTGLAIVDALRAHGAKTVAANCTYYDDFWMNNFVRFLEICGFEVIHASNLAQQGLVPTNAKYEDLGWTMTDELTHRSVTYVSRQAPTADAMVITGAGTRTLNILTELEDKTDRPVVAADTALYWAIAQDLHLTLKPNMSCLAQNTIQEEHIV